MQINRNYLNLQDSYLFSNVAQKVADFQSKNPDIKVIRLGIGDVTLPLCQAAVTAMSKAVVEMGEKESFRGYGPEQGYPFLREAICGYYQERGVTLTPDEVFVSDGAKSDIANILDIFSTANTVLIPDPVYPVYLDTNIMAGRKVLYMSANAGNSFLPLPDPDTQADIIYLCSPNNPTGAVYTKEMLQKWVDFANDKGAVILFDAAYESFIRQEGLPRSIMEIPGARTCAIEFCSLSKTAGFTGTRLGYTVVPQDLESGGVKLRGLWLRRQTTKFNGVPYIVQRGAEAVFTPEGRQQTREALDYYMSNAATIAKTLDKKGVYYTGGNNSPYIWLQCPKGMSSWDFFDFLLTKAHIVGTPGAGFGENGEGFFRLTAFGGKDATLEAMDRLEKVL